ncbi:MAG: hypothetical protein EBW16_02330 [Burkholderiaceae bacterium]|nr:hypothetical protein [Burkholderiaceae bacterium]NCV72195.1 hypothetical protein [Burkholderiaceae bacterium]
MPTQQLDYFATLVAEDEHFPLTEACIAVAQHAFPDLDVQHILDEIDQLGDRLKKRISADASAVQRLQQLKHFFYTELGFGPNPNDFYAPENSYLHHVLQSRRGIPISLAILMMELGNQIGLKIRGVSFPNHFMLRVSLPQGEIISRFLRNLKLIYTEHERWERLLGVQQRLVILLPDAMEEIRDRGLIYAQLEYLRPAIDDMQQYLTEVPDASDADEIREHIATLEHQVRQH